MTFQYGNTLKLMALSTLTLAIATAGHASEAWHEDGFSLEKLVTAARAEAPVTVYATTGKIVGIAEKFNDVYGLSATGTKVRGPAQIELMTREYQANNITGDLAISGDASAALAQLTPMGITESWVPPTMKGVIPENAQDPVVVIGDPSVWTYNTEVHDSCPVTNIWQLTDAEWNRKVAMPDPLNKPAYIDWFNQLETHYDDLMADAYMAHYGRAFEGGELSATATWVKALAENAPLLTSSDSAAGDAVGAPGQTDPFVGIMSTAKYRDNASGAVHLGICEDLMPFAGWSYPGYGLINTKTQSPNQARLFLHFLLTEEGVASMTVDGKTSGNSQVPAHPEEASGVMMVQDQILAYNAGSGVQDFDLRQDWQDFWRLNYRR